MLSCETNKIFKNTYFEEHLQTAVAMTSPLQLLLLCKMHIHHLRIWRHYRSSYLTKGHAIVNHNLWSRTWDLRWGCKTFPFLCQASIHKKDRKVYHWRVKNDPLFQHLHPQGLSCWKNCIKFNFSAWKVSKYGFFSGPYFPVSVFSPNTGKYGPEKTPYLDTFTQCFIHKKENPLNV